jgi:peptidyl-prolyl cis-trans isomerase D
MLQLIRSRAQGWLGWAIAIIICVPFALFGIAEYLGPDTNTTVIEVNGQEIGLQEFTTAHRRTRQQSQITESNPTIDELLRQNTVDRIVREQLLEQISVAQHLRISDEQLALAIQTESSFQRDGRFDQQAYTAALYQQGYQPGTFERAFRLSLVSDQIVSGLLDSAFATSGEAKYLAALELQQRTFSALRVDASKLGELAVGDDEIKAHYESNIEAFRSPERIKVAYLKLSVEDIARDVNPEDGTLESLYEARKDTFTTPEERQVRHILIELAADADEATVVQATAKIAAASARIAAGEDFAVVAKDTSEDPVSAEQGGDLGRIGRGLMDPTFDIAAFSQEVGAIGEPVRSPFGLHLIRVDSVEGGKVTSFDDIRERLLVEYRQTEAEKIYYADGERLANTAYEQPDNLDVAAEELNLKIKTSDWIVRGEISDDEIGKESALVRAAFSEDVLEGANSEPVQLDGEVVVLRMLEHDRASDQPLADVREQVEAAIRASKAGDVARTVGEELVRGLRSGMSVEEAAAKAGGAIWEKFENRGRRDRSVDVRVRELAFSMPLPGVDSMNFDGGVVGDNEFVVVSLTGSQVTAEADIEPITNLVTATVRRDLGQADFLAFVEWLREGADVTIRENQL